VALDAWAWSLLDSPSEKQPGFLALGEQLGLGQVDYQALAPVEVTVS